jgi:peptide deformylase
MAAAINLVIYPDQRLKTKGADVQNFDDALRIRLEHLEKSTRFFDGIGLAGCQIGYMERILYVDHNNIVQFWNERFNESTPLRDEPLFMVNPEIIDKSDDKFESNEACLSLPGVDAKVERASYIKVRYFDGFGKEQIIETKIPLLSACIQHEIDHTNGLTIAEHQSALKKNMIVKRIDKYMKSRHVVTSFDPDQEHAHECGDASCGHNH